MAPRKRKGPAAPVAQPQVANTHASLALPNEIYLEIISHIPSVPIPTPLYSPRYVEMRCSRHKTLLSLSQTCRFLRSVFLRYLWQRIEVREGIRIGENEFLKGFNNFRSGNNKAFTVELVRQLEIVTIRNPHLAQHVNYLDIVIGEYSFDAVTTELARCMNLFSNLHTVQIDIGTDGLNSRRNFKKIFQKKFSKYSYPQIRNAFIMSRSMPLLLYCPKVERMGFTPWVTTEANVWDMLDVTRNLPRLEALDDFGSGNISFPFSYELIVNEFPALRHITLSTAVICQNENSFNALSKMNHLQSITVVLSLYHANRFEGPSPLKLLEKVLVAIQRRDNLVKYLIVIDSDTLASQTITLQPPHIEL